MNELQKLLIGIFLTGLFTLATAAAVDRVTEAEYYRLKETNSLPDGTVSENTVTQGICTGLTLTITSVICLCGYFRYQKSIKNMLYLNALKKLKNKTIAFVKRNITAEDIIFYVNDPAVNSTAFLIELSRGEKTI
jgi:hypothetical protein